MTTEPTKVRGTPYALRASNKKNTYTTPKGHKVRLTPSQKDYADKKLEHPKASLVKIAQQAYPNAAPNTLRQIVNHNENSKDVAIYSDDQVAQAKTNIVGIANDDDIKAETRLKANQDILDRTDGKAIQKTVNTNTNLNVNIEAKQELNEAFKAFLSAQTKQS